MSNENIDSDPQENNQPEEEDSSVPPENVDLHQDNHSQGSYYQNTLTDQFNPRQNYQLEQERPPVRLTNIGLHQSNHFQESHSQNTLTDQFNLVQREEAKGILRLFSRQRSVSDGFCLVIFRKDEYRGSIISDDVITEGDLKRRSERLGVRDGDTILRVNLGSHPLSITETLGTQDGYTRYYTLELEFRVSDPRNFAQRYLQWSDPVKFARTAIEGYLQRYAIRKRHDELREDMLGDHAEQALREGSNRSFGIEIVAAHKITLFMDPTRIKELEILKQSRIKQIETEEETNIRKASVRGDAEVKRLETEFEREHASLTARFERIEDERLKRYEMYMDEEKAGQRRIEEMKEDEHRARRDNFKIQEANKKRDLMHIYGIEELGHQSERLAYERRQKLLQAAEEKEMEDILQQIEYGRPLNELANEHPDMFQPPARTSKKDVTQGPFRIEEVTNRTRPASAANDRSNVASTDTTSQPVSARQETTPSQPSPLPRQETTSQPFTQMTGTLPGILRQPNDTIDITDLGMTLKKIELSVEQHAIAATHTPTAFSVSAVDEHGPAHRAELTIGDIVIEINGEEPRDTQSILGILKSYKPGSSVPLCILRGEDLINVEV